MWASLFKKNNQTITNEFPNFLSTSKRSPLKLENDRGAEVYNSSFQNFLKKRNIQYFSRFTGKGPSIAERVIKTVRNLLEKPVFEKGNHDWLSELPSVIKRYKNTIHNSIKMPPIQASSKSKKRSLFKISKIPEEFENQILV